MLLLAGGIIDGCIGVYGDNRAEIGSWIWAMVLGEDPYHIFEVRKMDS